MINLARRDLKNRTPIGSAIKIELYNSLKEYSEKSKIPMSKLLDEAIEEFLKTKKT